MEARKPVMRGGVLLCRRPGLSLVIVLFLSFAAVLISLNMLLLFEWASGSARASRRHLEERWILSSLVADRRHWLQEKLKEGLFYSPADSDDENENKKSPATFAELILPGSHKSDENEGTKAFVDVYDLNYVYDLGSVSTERWFNSSSPEGFFPPRPGAFLIRAVKEGEGKRILNVVVTVHNGVLDRRPLLWQEIWL